MGIDSFKVCEPSVRDEYGRFKRIYHPWSLENFNDGFIGRDGRFIVYAPWHHRATVDGYVNRAVIAYETYHNDVVEDGYVIHHRNMNKLDDTEPNLEKMKFGRHSSLHSNSCGEIRRCKTCGIEFHAPLYRLNEKGVRRGQYCSRECHYKGRSIR
ncbi:MAG: hypothetical protein WC516_07890 [Patescibacteria group bacterium]